MYPTNSQNNLNILNNNLSRKNSIHKLNDLNLDNINLYTKNQNNSNNSFNNDTSFNLE